jgi:VCBS repeat-containing protein
MTIIPKGEDDDFTTIARTAVSGDVILFALGNHGHWKVKANPAHANYLNWKAGEKYTIRGTPPFVVTGNVGTTVQAGTLTMSGQQPDLTVDTGFVTVAVSTLTMTGQQPTFDVIIVGADIDVSLSTLTMGAQQPALIAGGDVTEPAAILLSEPVDWTPLTGRTARLGYLRGRRADFSPLTAKPVEVGT